MNELVLKSISLSQEREKIVPADPQPQIPVIIQQIIDRPSTVAEKKEIEEKKEVITQHPFLGVRKEQQDNRISTLEQLDVKRVDYNEILLKNGIDQSQVTRYAIDLDFLNESNNNFDVKTSTSTTERITQNWSLLDIINKNPPKGWLSVLQASYNDLIRVNQFLMDKEKAGITIYPLKENIFKAYVLTAPEDIKVVILGQDPYPGESKITNSPYANGLAFSTDKGNGIPQSLANIFKVMQQKVNGFILPSHGDLTAWANRGVFLLNTCLTLDKGSSDSHKGLWSDFITRTIHHIDKTNPNCIYMLWGAHAQKYAAYTKSKHILTTSHPSNQSFRLGFNNCNHFNEANEILRSLGKSEIDWNL